MSILQKIQNYFRTRTLQERLRELGTGQRKKVNFESTQSIGLLFDATNRDKRQAVLKYADQLGKQGKKVRLLGFVDVKEEPKDLSFPFFFRKDIDWAQRPIGDKVEGFLKTSFDMLITLDPQPQAHCEYIAALSRAHFKIGPSTENTYCHDLMIEVANKNNLSDFIREMETLLTKTNIKHAAISQV
jgi:hypothetical protein